MCPQPSEPSTGGPPETPPHLGFVGLGEMGSLMAARLAEWPGGLSVYDVRPEATEPLAQRGAHAAASIEELAGAARIIGLMVLDDDQVRTVLDAVLPVAEPGTVVAVHSTIHPTTAAGLAAAAGARGVAVLDAPVSGGVTGARAGRLALMVGGDRSALDRCREPFGLFADLILHFGPLGAGTRAKLARNLINFVGIAAALEAARLAEASGVDIAKLARVTTHSDALVGGPGTVMIRDSSEPLAPDDPLRAIFGHASTLGEKDLALALELGERCGVDLPLAEVAHRHLAGYLGVPHEEDR